MATGPPVCGMWRRRWSTRGQINHLGAKRGTVCGTWRPVSLEVGPSRTCPTWWDGVAVVVTRPPPVLRLATLELQVGAWRTRPPRVGHHEHPPPVWPVWPPLHPRWEPGGHGRYRWELSHLGAVGGTGRTSASRVGAGLTVEAEVGHGLQVEPAGGGPLRPEAEPEVRPGTPARGRGPWPWRPGPSPGLRPAGGGLGGWPPKVPQKNIKTMTTFMLWCLLYRRS